LFKVGSTMAAARSEDVMLCCWMKLF